MEAKDFFQNRLTQTVMSELRKGYGVDDIYIRRRIDPDYSRWVIRLLRKSGNLSDLYRGTA